MMIIVSLLVCIVLISLCAETLGQKVEEFHAHGPMQFHDLAMGAFLEMRKINPKETLTGDSPFLQKASEHAVKRLSRRPDEDFELRVRVTYPIFLMVLYSVLSEVYILYLFFKFRNWTCLEIVLGMDHKKFLSCRVLKARILLCHLQSMRRAPLTDKETR
jgi:hypothetical protein